LLFGGVALTGLRIAAGVVLSSNGLHDARLPSAVLPALFGLGLLWAAVSTLRWALVRLRMARYPLLEVTADRLAWQDGRRRWHVPLASLHAVELVDDRSPPLLRLYVKQPANRRVIDIDLAHSRHPPAQLRAAVAQVLQREQDSAQGRRAGPRQLRLLGVLAIVGVVHAMHGSIARFVGSPAAARAFHLGLVAAAVVCLVVDAGLEAFLRRRGIDPARYELTSCVLRLLGWSALALATFAF
jgi:hypothetical protein